MKTISSFTADQFKEMIINNATKDPSISKNITFLMSFRLPKQMK